ncbi:Selenoprotein W [Trichinella nelsoni]|uniref:Selenoprotein W n=1 Tax=Trichinella nelsoni TaxID=6336 RepID=A0A0V0SBH7_9BILA|nr:Selenoprotein W [Trichinella nelsoni]
MFWKAGNFSTNPFLQRDIFFSVHFNRSVRLQEKGAEKLKKDILNKFPQNVSITLEGTPQVTGFMEVTVNGKLVHSKKNGDGYVNTTEKLEKIFAAIEASLSC